MAAMMTVAAQSASATDTSNDRVMHIYGKHLQCGVDISVARTFVKRAQPQILSQYEEAMSSYFNRMYGVGEVAELTSQQVIESMLEKVRLEMSKLASYGSDVAAVSAQFKVHVDRAKECLRSVGYSVN